MRSSALASRYFYLFIPWVFARIFSEDSPLQGTFLSFCLVMNIEMSRVERKTIRALIVQCEE